MNKETLVEDGWSDESVAEILDSDLVKLAIEGD